MNTVKHVNQDTQKYVNQDTQKYGHLHNPHT